MLKCRQWLAGLFILWAFPGCWTDGEFPDEVPNGCGASTCLDRLDLRLDNAEGADFPPGQYDWEVELGQRRVEQLQCALLGSSLTCQGSELLSTMRLEGRNRFELNLGITPTRLRLRLRFNEIWTYDQSITPKYHMVTPNGPECDPICFQATTYLTMHIQADTKGSTP